MAKLVLMHKLGSGYDDEPPVRYEFPDVYLSRMRDAVGDWIVYYEPGRRAQRYFAVAHIADIVRSDGNPGHHFAEITPETYLPLVDPVPRLDGGRPLESALRAADGSPIRGGQAMSAVRRLPDAEFAAIVNRGLPADLEAVEARRYDPAGPGLAEPITAFDRPVIERLTRRAFRDMAFRRRVREAYGHRCALSGLTLRNGGGRPEVEAAHIVPVARGGSDSVRNGLALSGTLHWMFDRGLVSVAGDLSILVSGNKVPGDVAARLLVPDRQIRLPADARDHPSREALRWHREHVFGQWNEDGPAPW
ncbi:HNH endonuclease [Jannaschia sp. W003]|uniref:HNH endonuclease n=1 Tax=Jannaschia sp. W003 TaxID=2867012 RepID=UPI0021A6AFC8|nr:HNH endonuclease [Jannaschia sp. W003]UWQ22580.1 HNH endonuclease [Jannaschia sp. W003]